MQPEPLYEGGSSTPRAGAMPMKTGRLRSLKLSPLLDAENFILSNIIQNKAGAKKFGASNRLLKDPHATPPCLVDGRGGHRLAARISEDVEQSNDPESAPPEFDCGIHDSLHNAVWGEDFDLVRSIVGEDPSVLHDTDSGGQNIMHLAAFWGCLASAALYL